MVSSFLFWLAGLCFSHFTRKLTGELLLGCHLVFTAPAIAYRIREPADSGMPEKVLRAGCMAIGWGMCKLLVLILQGVVSRCVGAVDGAVDCRFVPISSLSGALDLVC